MNERDLKHIIEATLLAAGRPVPTQQILELFEERERPTPEEFTTAIGMLMADYESRGIEVLEVASGWRIQVRPRAAEVVSRLWQERPSRYSRALLETLALVAYRQPITRSEIEEIRGVSISSTIMRTLQERNWIRVVGHREVPGRPELLGTTREFLDYFGLKSLDQLPTLAELKDLETIGVQLELPAGEPAAAENAEGGAEADAASAQAQGDGAAAADAAPAEGTGAADAADAAQDPTSDATENTSNDAPSATSASELPDAVSSSDSENVEGASGGEGALESAPISESASEAAPENAEADASVSADDAAGDVTPADEADEPQAETAAAELSQTGEEIATDSDDADTRDGLDAAAAEEEQEDGSTPTMVAAEDSDHSTRSVREPAHED